MSADADKNAPESQFQKVGDLVERDDDTGLVEVESLCMNCHDNGTTRLLLLRVPFFRDIILESFECPHCYFKDNSIKSAGEIQAQGIKYTLDVQSESDMQRQVVRGDTSIFKVESLGIEMPKGESQLTNVEGVISRIHESLSSEQPLRKAQAPELHDALQPLIEKLKAMFDGTGYPFTISLDDPTGNSWIAYNTQDKKNYRVSHYNRTHEQNEELGITADPEASKYEGLPAAETGDSFDDIVNDQVYVLPAECPACAKACDVKVKKVAIPYFKEVLLFGTNCAECGYRSSDVRVGGEIGPKGHKITLRVDNQVDLSRDVLKSDSCAMHCEELDLSVAGSTLGSKFTTIEGLLTEVRDQLHSTIFDAGDAGAGDSMASSDKAKWDGFFEKLNKAINGEMPFTITLQDPLANSYVQDLCAPAPDPQIKIEEYTRTAEEEDELGLKDMKTEGYEEDAEQQEEQKS